MSFLKKQNKNLKQKVCVWNTRKLCIHAAMNYKSHGKRTPSREARPPSRSARPRKFLYLANSKI